ncbi:hypothetical protein LOD99_491 [Oopsacas minuta]|uniref:Uncharacterized protein n=1 Tax=Oopsacas minuta TaxID=111878 RepID=A0AAV7K9I3_9METZ|nr:hypothetical protein LOD99_491 [Oopsacas minuta]
MDNKFSLCRKELIIEVRRLFSAYNDKSSFDKSGSPNNLFDTVWRDWKSSFQCVPIDTTDISNDLQEVLFKYSKLKQLDVFNMKQGLILDSTKFKLVGRVEFDELYTTLSIPQTHENSYYKIVDYQQRSILFVFLNINNQISNANQQRLQSIQTDHTQIIDSIIRKFPKNGNYSIDYFSFLIDKCISLITEHNTTEKSTNARQAILFTNHYIFDFTFYQCCRAITTFEELQDHFIEQNSLEFKLGSLESSMREIFSQICSGIKSENLCASKLSSIIFSGIRMYLKDTLLQLLQHLFVNDPKHDSTYSNRGFLHLYILKDLAKKKVFEDYISYINSPFSYINSFILKNIQEYSKEETVITNILFTLNQTTQDLKTHCIDAANSVSRNIDSWDEWKQHFHESIIKFVRSVKLSDLDILDMYDVENYEQFSDLFAKTLEDSIKTFNWRAWISKVLTLDIFYELQEIIASSLVECRALCPFCKEPCQLSAGEHKHYCGTFHRPQGISGWHFINSRKIDVDECTTSIRCNHTFLFEEKLYNYPNYRTVNEYFKSWKILADDSIVSKYWQWVLYTFQKNLLPITRY